LTFALANPTRAFGGGSLNNTMAVSLGSAFSEVFNRTSPADFSRVSREFTVTENHNVRLVFAHEGGDNLGLLIDNISLTAVPVPGLVWLTGLAALGLIHPRRRHLR